MNPILPYWEKSLNQIRKDLVNCVAKLVRSQILSFIINIIIHESDKIWKVIFLSDIIWCNTLVLQVIECTVT